MAAGMPSLRKIFDRISGHDGAWLNRKLLEKCVAPRGITAEREQKLCAEILDLVDRGADIHAKDGNGRTPLALVASAGCLTAAETALSLGADANGAADGGITPLMNAAIYCDPAMMELLLRHKADPNQPDTGKNTAAHCVLEMASKKENESATFACLKLLLEHGATLDGATETKIFRQARHLAPLVPEVARALEFAEAVKQRDHAKMKELLDAGVHPDVGAKYGDNASLIYLSTANDVAGMEMLLKAGADVNLVSPIVRKTPLLNAATHGCKEACKLLIDYGADEKICFQIPGGGKDNVYGFAERSGTPGLAEYIEELVAARAWQRANPPPPDITLAERIAVSKPLQLKPGVQQC